MSGGGGVGKRGAVTTAIALAIALLVLSYGWRCPFQVVTGVPCPTCGITRATRLALQGDISGALHLHPLWWLAVPVTALFGGIEVVGYARTGAWGTSRRMRGTNALMLTTASLLFVVWLARFAGFFGGPV